MSDSIRVAVLMGGMSSEHEVSLMSGKGVCAALAPAHYTVTPVTITREGQWLFGGDAPRSIFEAIPHLRALEIDCVFIALHGPFGEDGRIQGMLDLLGLPYTGSGCAASALAMDKVRCKTIVSAQGIPVAGHVALDRATWAVDAETVVKAVREQIGYPCVVKPARQGSSVGIHFPNDDEALRAALDSVFDIDDYLMIEEMVRGVELTCGVLNVDRGGLIEALPVTEIRPKTAAYFDYGAKYTPGATEEITPARIPHEMAEQVRQIAAHVHEAVGCAGWSRSDFILGEEGPMWLEVNTVPGLTPTSLYPQACAAVGINYADMCGLFIEAAMRKKH